MSELKSNNYWRKKETADSYEIWKELVKERQLDLDRANQALSHAKKCHECKHPDDALHSFDAGERIATTCDLCGYTWHD